MSTDNPKQFIRTCNLCNYSPAWVLPSFFPHWQNPSELKTVAAPCSTTAYEVVKGWSLHFNFVHSSSEAKSLLLFLSTESSQALEMAQAGLGRLWRESTQSSISAVSAGREQVWEEWWQFPSNVLHFCPLGSNLTAQERRMLCPDRCGSVCHPDWWDHVLKQTNSLQPSAIRN